MVARNCSFVENTAGSEGGAVYVSTFGTCYMRNGVMWNDAPFEWGGTGTQDAMYSDVEGGTTTGGNIIAYPNFVSYPSVSGDWSYREWYPDPYQTWFTDLEASWTPGELAGRLVQIDADTDTRLYAIAGNSEDTVYVWGDFSDLSYVGVNYRIIDLRLDELSPCTDAAATADAPELDRDGNAREDDPLTDDTGSGDPPLPDMGAYEYQPDDE